jgi:hypothetical protein
MSFDRKRKVKKASATIVKATIAKVPFAFAEKPKTSIAIQLSMACLAMNRGFALKIDAGPKVNLRASNESFAVSHSHPPRVDTNGH